MAKDDTDTTDACPQVTPQPSLPQNSSLAPPLVCAVTPNGTTTISASTAETRDDWTQVAMTAAFGAGTAKDIRNKKAWFVGTGASFQANMSIIHAVYDYYGSLYKRNPSKCIWGGLARVAGGPFFWGFQFIDSCIQSINGYLQALDADPCAHVPDTMLKAFICSLQDPQEAQAEQMEKAVYQTAHDEFQTSIESLMTMGKLIFLDMSWQHEAYLAKGLPEILRLGGQPGVFDPVPDRQQFCVDAWKLIDSGADAQKGNCNLFQREQLITISSGYARLAGLLGVPTVMSFLADKPHPWGKDFVDYFHMAFKLPPWGGDPASTAQSAWRWSPTSMVWSHSVTTDADRWNWMSNNIYPTWMSVSEAKRQAMVEATLENLSAGSTQWPAGL